MNTGVGLVSVSSVPSPRLLFLLPGPGVALIQALSALTGLQVQAPMGLATGSFQSSESAPAGSCSAHQTSRLLTSVCSASPAVLDRWSDGSSSAGPPPQQAAVPALRFVSDSALQGWCRQAEWMEEALQELRGLLGPRLQRLSLQIRGRALGARRA